MGTGGEMIPPSILQLDNSGTRFLSFSGGPSGIKASSLTIMTSVIVLMMACVFPCLTFPILHLILCDHSLSKLPENKLGHWYVFGRT